MPAINRSIDGSISLNLKTFTDGKLAPTFNDQAVQYKGLYSTVIDGTVIVHPIRNAEGENLPIILLAGVPSEFVQFDYIVETGTMEDLSGVYVIPF